MNAKRTTATQTPAAKSSSTSSASGVAKKPTKKSLAEATKLFVLDTNVLMHDPLSLYRFEEHDIFLPMMVLEELDANKKGMTEVARNARQASRMLDDIVSGAEHHMAQGIRLDGASRGLASGHLFLQTEAFSGILPASLPTAKADNQIIGVVIHLSQKFAKRPVILVSKDINMRIKHARWVWRRRTTLTTRCWKIPICFTPVPASYPPTFGRRTAKVWNRGKRMDAPITDCKGRCARIFWSMNSSGKTTRNRFKPG